MRILCVIPARIGSSRLPHKPLQTISEQPLIRLVTQRVLDFKVADRVVVATDDERVADAVRDLGAATVVGTERYASGTERTAAVAGMPRFADAEIVVNVQGDEPFIPAEAVSGAIGAVESGAEVGTAGAPVDARGLADRNMVKVFVGPDGRALAFSRGPRPAPDVGEAVVLHHVGVYAYRPEALRRWVSSEPVPAEIEEELEQLRPLSRGESIVVHELDEAAPSGIDTQEDLERARSLTSVFH
jgi:3-deoxy-manno-octulosonate cytidylyltransferase (CMP-KDO synthetase)